MYDHNANGSAIADALRQEGVSADALRRAVEDQLHRSSQTILNGLLPRDVHHRYATIATAESDAITHLAEQILSTLKAADAGAHVLSGKVAEKVKEGIAEITKNHDYTHASKSIT